MNPHDKTLLRQAGVDLYGTVLASRMLLGTAGYPSPAVLGAAVKASGAGVVTVSLRRETAGGGSGQSFFNLVQDFGVQVLPNTAGCRSAREAITTAQMAREVFGTDWIKLEVIGNDDTLQPDVFGLVEAADVLNRDGFKVFPYTTEDLSVAERLQRAGCKVIMPWGAPIGTGQGISNRRALESLRAYFPDVALIVDAGIGAPSHAAEAMELGFDAVLLNTAVAKAADPVRMALAFAQAIAAGRTGYEAGLMPPRDMAVPSTPIAGTPFFDLDADT
ncbi:MAG: thiazole synthase [Hyphomicrobium sp.]